MHREYGNVVVAVVLVVFRQHWAWKERVMIRVLGALVHEPVGVMDSMCFAALAIKRVVFESTGLR